MLYMASLSRRIQDFCLRRQRNQHVDPGVNVTQGRPPGAGGIQHQSPVTLHEIRPTGGAEDQGQTSLTLHDQKKPASEIQDPELQLQPPVTLYEIRPTSGAEGVPLSLHDQKPASETRSQRRTVITLRGQEHTSKTKDQHQSHPPRDQEPSTDPLIAAQIQNMKESHLARLPEELLLCVLDSIGDDIVALFCLRRVSRKFRRVINTKRIWEHMRLPLWWQRNEICTDTPNVFSNDERQQMHRLLRHNGMCDDCKPWCRVSPQGWSICAEQLLIMYAIDHRLDGACKFQAFSSDRLDCHGCGTSQNVGTFAPSDQDPSYKEYRQCLGRQGAVKLCEHVRVYWSDIESHMMEWKRRRPGGWDEEDWKACMDNFRVECRDPSHEGECAAGDGPMWPRARLEDAVSGPRTVILSLEWNHHSRLDALTYHPGGRARASDIRALIKECRAGAGGILFSSARPDSLPEMECYDSTKCRCLYYQVEGDETPVTESPQPNHRLPLSHTFPRCGHPHRVSRGSPDHLTESFDATNHGTTGADPSCLVMRYQRRVALFKRENRGTKHMNPGHAWFHAMDPGTYPRPSGLRLPLCRREDCMNYCRRPKAFSCFRRGSLSIHE